MDRAEEKKHHEVESGDSTEGGSVEEMKPKEREEITDLARQISEVSRQNTANYGEPVNPFLDASADPELDPSSEQFNQTKWVKNMLHITSRDPERYPRRTAGVTFRNLNAYGYGTAADYQADVFNTWLKAFGYVRGMLGLRKKMRIDILRDFEGLVKSGEMLVVLGRPGRWATFLPGIVWQPMILTGFIVVVQHFCARCAERPTASGSTKGRIFNTKVFHMRKCTHDSVARLSTKPSKKSISLR